MKKKVIAVFIAAMLTASLLGCGAKGSETTDGGETVNVVISNKTAAKTDTVSEFFSKGKHWACRARNNSKEAYLLEIYFFDDGKVTVLPGDVFGGTLGDLAQMSDEEIWDKYEKVKESYKTTYVQKKQMALLNGKTTDELNSVINVLSQVNGKSIVEMEKSDQGELIYLYNSALSLCYDFGISIQEADYDVPIDATHAINTLKAIVSGNLKFAGPFYDLPVIFAIATDGTGNATEHEYIYYRKTDEYYVDGEYEIKVNRGSVNHFDINRGGTGGEVNIYDKNIFYYAITDGNYFCTTEYLKLDDPKSTNCLVDFKQEEITTILNDMK